MFLKYRQVLSSKNQYSPDKREIQNNLKTLGSVYSQYLLLDNSKPALFDEEGHEYSFLSIATKENRSLSEVDREDLTNQDWKLLNSP